MNIDFANLRHQHSLYKEEIEHAVLAVMEKCDFIMGEEIIQLEKALEEFTGVKHAITCSSGTCTDDNGDWCWG
jgi:UDP-2-acetamido-2-deoxy-ribo-hexuluronate aminotransferase